MVRVQAWCRWRCGLKALALCTKSCLRCNSLARHGGADQCVRLVVAPFAFLFFADMGNSLEVRVRSLAPNAVFCKQKQKSFFCWQGRVTWRFALRRGVFFFEEASCQTRFFEAESDGWPSHLGPANKELPSGTA